MGVLITPIIRKLLGIITQIIFDPRDGGKRAGAETEGSTVNTSPLQQASFTPLGGALRLETSY